MKLTIKERKLVKEYAKSLVEKKVLIKEGASSKERFILVSKAYDNFNSKFVTLPNGGGPYREKWSQRTSNSWYKVEQLNLKLQVALTELEKNISKEDQ